MRFTEGGSFGSEGMLAFQATTQPMGIPLETLQTVPDAQPAVLPFPREKISDTVIFIRSMPGDITTELSSSPDHTDQARSTETTIQTLKTFVDIRKLPDNKVVLADIAEGLPDPSVRERYHTMDPKAETVTFDNREWKIQANFQPRWEKVGEMRVSGGSVIPIDGTVLRRELTVFNTKSPERYAQVTNYVEMTSENQKVFTYPGKVIETSDGRKIKVITQRLTAEEAQQLSYSHIVAAVQNEELTLSAPQYPEGKIYLNPKATVYNEKTKKYEVSSGESELKSNFGEFVPEVLHDAEAELARPYPYPGLPHTVLENSEIIPTHLDIDFNDIVDLGAIPEEDIVAGRVVNKQGVVIEEVRGKLVGRISLRVNPTMVKLYEWFRADPRLLRFGMPYKGETGTEVIIERWVPTLPNNDDLKYNLSGELRKKTEQQQEQKAA